jgi:hypothetical protein
LIASGNSPITAQPDLLERLEQSMIGSWSQNANPSLQTLIESIQPPNANLDAPLSVESPQ